MIRRNKHQETSHKNNDNDKHAKETLLALNAAEPGEPNDYDYEDEDYEVNFLEQRIADTLEEKLEEQETPRC